MAEAVNGFRAMETAPCNMNLAALCAKGWGIAAGLERYSYRGMAYLLRGLNIPPAILVTKLRGTRRSP
jgi:hypothetical protein